MIPDVKSVACPTFSSLLLNEFFCRNYECVKLPLALKWLEEVTISVFAKAYRAVDRRAILGEQLFDRLNDSFNCRNQEICKAVATDRLVDQCAVQHTLIF